VARTQFRVEVLTPEGSVFDEEVEMVSTRTEVGSIGILARHEPVLGLLVPTELRLYRSESEIVSYAQGEGYVQVSEDGVLVLVEEAHKPEELDLSDLKEKLSKADSEHAAAEPDSEDQARASRDKRRWEAFIRIAEVS
jgi:F-type H+-transporting ATPase subunit epsilon